MKFKIALIGIFVSTQLVGMQQDLMRAGCPALPPNFFCKEQLKKVWKIRKKLDACCTELDMKFDQLQEEVERINACGRATPISTDGFTISEPGRYCLTADVSGTLSIQADNVIVDLNNHKISGGVVGIAIQGQRSNIIIMNGKIENTTTALATEAATNEALALLNIEFRDNKTAVAFNGVRCFKISKCSVEGHQAPTLVCFNNCQNGIIRSCFMHDNAVQNGIEIAASSNNITLHDVHVDNNSSTINSRTTGFLIQGTNCTLYKCTANKNQNSDAQGLFAGIHVASTASNIMLFRCQAHDNSAVSTASGFLLTGAQIIVDSSSASGNSGGPGYGFEVEKPAVRICCIDCLAKQNATHGFFIGDVIKNYFLRNIAVGNGSVGFFANSDMLAQQDGFFSNYAAFNPVDNYSKISADIKTYNVGLALTAGTIAWSNISVEV